MWLQLQNLPGILREIINLKIMRNHGKVFSDIKVFFLIPYHSSKIQYRPSLILQHLFESVLSRSESFWGSVLANQYCPIIPKKIVTGF